MTWLKANPKEMAAVKEPGLIEAVVVAKVQRKPGRVAGGNIV